MMTSRWISFRESLLVALPLVVFSVDGVVARTAAQPNGRGANDKNAADVVVSDSDDDPFAVPKGSPDDVLAFIQSLANPQRQFASNDELQDYLKNVAAAISEATDQILAGKATDQQMVDAVEWRMEAQRIKAKLGDANAAKETEDFLANPEFQKRPALAKAIAQIRLLSEQKQAMSKLRNWQRMNTAERDAFIDEFVTAIKAGELTGEQFNMAMAVTEMLGDTEDSALAARALDELLPLFQASDDPSVGEQLPLLEGIGRRLNLPGKKFELAGTLLDGTPIDWASYRGKVVLVDYWATWCGPCRAEVPNVLENYKKYHDQGFDVVGISLDEDRRAVQQYMRESGIPWPTLFHDKAQGDAWGNPMAIKYGVTGIPRAILVDRKGNVVNLNARGPRLEAELKRLFANPAAEDTSSTVEVTDGGVTAQSER